ncbi:MAG: hypothetical protein P8Y14_07685 [Anaerolineales bacterium]|jgi:hypothetical protein
MWYRSAGKTGPPFLGSGRGVRSVRAEELQARHQEQTAAVAWNEDYLLKVLARLARVGNYDALPKLEGASETSLS